MGFLWRLAVAVLLSVCGIADLGWALKRGRYEHLEAFCDGPDVYYVSLPWDCSGYVHCLNLGSQKSAYWIACPANLYYSMEAKTCMWPKDVNIPCPPLKDVIDKYCADNPTARFQNPEHCAQYYDCTDASFSPGLGPFLKECPFPQLYNTNAKMCTRQASVQCEDRFTPLSQCDYVQHVGGDCSVQTTPGCAGQPNGNNPYPGRLLTEYYLVCQGNQTVNTGTCPAGTLFDPIRMVCISDIDPLSVEIYCAAHPDRKTANPGNCAQYFDCTAGVRHPQLGNHQSECPYPQLFSTQTNRCEMFQQVQCNARKEPRAPCEYASNVAGGSMEACMASYYICVNLPDGSNPITVNELSSSYIMCLVGRTVEVKSCPMGNTYDPMLRTCIENMEIGLVARQCRETPGAVLPDPDNCARYFNCSQVTTISGLQKFQAECDYPLLFNARTLACDDFTQVQCGIRVEPKAPCDYSSTTRKCEGPLCALPCLERSPSCVGSQDGNNTYPGRELSSFYMTCLGERTVSVGICRFGVYDPTPRMCMGELAPESIQGYCQRNPASMVPHYTNCARLYNCSNYNPTPGAGNYLQECPYPQLFNMETMMCDQYQNVQCRFRFQPTEPCEYLQNQFCPQGQAQCAPCVERLPVCTGLEGGNNTFIGKDSYYIVCETGRTLAVRECIGATFDPLTRACKAASTIFSQDMLKNPVRYCTANPTAIFENTLQCSQYFDCRQKVTLLGNFKIECPYPQLFDSVTKSCQHFGSVQCGIKTVPLEPCEYESNLRCPDVGACTPCRQRFESCKGNPDGSYATASSNRKYKVCMSERTVEVRECLNGGTYDETAGSCQVQLDPRNPAAYCASNPTKLVPNPDNCGQFFDCGQQNTVFGNFLRECPYLQLFSPADSTCHSFETGVNCMGRPEPKAPCDYLQNQQCNSPTGCEPCEQLRPSCVGLMDGNNTFPGRDSQYIVCGRERTLAINSCPTGIFDANTRACVVPDMSDPNVVCSMNSKAMFQHPSRCAQYYDCRFRNSALGNYLQECPYPSLFEPSSKACQDFTTVTCGIKYEPIGPCDYVTNSCTGKGPDCIPCADRFVSCVGRPDGNNSFTGQDWTNKYVACQQGRTAGEFTCTSGYFDPIRRICATRLSAESIKRYCQINPDTLVANPLNCAQYFDCAPASVTANTFLRECPYPMLFSDVASVCGNFTDVTCGSRMEPTEPCQYLQNLCNRNDAKCIPCAQRLPSCTGLLDGNNAKPGSGTETSKEYLVCQQGRTLSTERCAQGTFDPNTRSCGIVMNEDAATGYCQANPTALLAHPTNCAQYYDCRQAVGGSFLRECRYPQLFDVVDKTCRNFSDVQCGAIGNQLPSRYEPQAPCEYLQTQCLQGATNCKPCEERLPSCVGLPDNNNPFPGRASSQYYVRCYRNRTVAVEVCQVSLYDATSRVCSNQIDAAVLGSFCKENPTVLIPDPVHCSRYYNCSDASAVQGLGVQHKQECRYPRLFGYGATSCQLFTEVQCKERYEPQAPCEYVENQCFNKTCEPCDKSFPSCVGLNDGSNIFPGKEGTEYYIVCYQNRTVAIVTCTLGYYNHATRVCKAVEQTTPARPALRAGGV